MQKHILNVNVNTSVKVYNPNLNDVGTKVLNSGHDCEVKAKVL